jgi:uncharacterized membrane protein YdjX (TVP38/TMEM64 family)
VSRARRSSSLALLLAFPLLSCAAELPTLEDVNGVVRELREYRLFAWALGIVAIWGDLVMPVPQTSVIAALGIVYGRVGGGLVGSVGLITAGLLAYAIARRFGRRPVARLVGDETLAKVERWFERAGVWAIVLTRSLGYSIPEAVVLVAGLGRMRPSRFLAALSVGSIPTAFVFSAIGAGWQEQPALALALSYALPIPLLPLVLLLMRDRREKRGPSDGSG